MKALNMARIPKNAVALAGKFAALSQLADTTPA
jgi:hypothetical protein